MAFEMLATHSASPSALQYCKGTYSFDEKTLFALNCNHPSILLSTHDNYNNKN
jgi:hypothetical protein